MVLDDNYQLHCRVFNELMEIWSKLEFGSDSNGIYGVDKKGRENSEHVQSETKTDQIFL